MRRWAAPDARLGKTAEPAARWRDRMIRLLARCTSIGPSFLVPPPSERERLVAVSDRLFAEALDGVHVTQSGRLGCPARAPLDRDSLNRHDSR